ncbi:glycosyl hydrolase [Solicola sp. PLA-1-18]|uniref:glycosyl hydrolase n=1 Tax=Solicola sp. PLA-1-18 TaxID=3380532 RepID=UPI003B81E0EE
MPRPRLSARLARRAAVVTTLLAVAVSVTPGVVAGAPVAAPQRAASSSPRMCTHAAHDVTQVPKLSAMVRREYSCVLVFNDAATSWRGISDPWFIVHNDPKYRWDRWVQAKRGRQLVIAQSLIPAGAPRNWRALGATGRYDAHFRRLGANLVAAGLGGSVIRLAHEGNGDWFRHRAGTTRKQQRQWARYWARAARALKSTPGSSFTLDLTVAAGSPVLPMKYWYPGDKAVDVIGADFYDRVLPGQPRRQPKRWRFQRTQRGGLDDLARFARAHRKPLSIPEWGLAARKVGGAGDSPAYIRKMIAFARRNDVVYMGYWNSPGPSHLRNNPKSLREYRRLVKHARF